ncbi:unnamed protein product [Sympodiomycopsis kandeliae]
MGPLQHHLIRGLLRAWRGPPPPGGAAPRHWAQPGPLLRHDLGQGRAAFHHGKPNFSRSSARQTHSSSSHATHLTPPFLALLHAFVDPILRGALQVLRTSKPTPSNRLTVSFRQTQNVFVRSGAGSRRPTTAFAARPFGHTYEAGLQTARHFSQSSVQTAQQAALGLRLALDQARDELSHGKGKGKAKPGKVARGQSKAKLVSPNDAVRQNRIWANEDIENILDGLYRPKTAAARRRAPRAPRNLDELDVYFPEPTRAPLLAQSHTVAGPSRFDSYACAELIVPLDPDLTNIFDLTQPSSSSSATYETIYNGRLGTATLETSKAYDRHLHNTQRLHAILQDVCPCVAPFQDSVQPVHAPHSAHQVGYKIVIPGHSAHQVREILIERLGMQQGLWFGKLLRDIPPSHLSSEETASPYTASSHSSPNVLRSPPQTDDWDLDSVSSLSSSWDGMLHDPPSSSSSRHSHMHPGLGFSSEFLGAVDYSHYPAYHRTSQYGLYPEEADQDDHLQDSR